MFKIKSISLILLSILVLLPSTVLASTERGSRESTASYASPGPSNASGITVNEVSSTLTAQQLVNNLLGAGVKVSNVKFIGKSGTGASAGIFNNAAGIFKFGSGIVLSTGAAKGIIGPNNSSGYSASNGLAGDSTLNTLIPGYTTKDATVLEFDFVPVTSQIAFKYQFASEEYNEYVGSSFNDVFGFFVNGKNIALIPGTNTPVSINNVNKGKNPKTDAGKNPGYYINNDAASGAKLNTQMDGMTVMLTAVANVTPNKTNHIKLAIADAGDSVLDSNVLIKADSFVATYTVKFNSNGGSSVPSQLVAYKGKVVKPTNPTKAGYTFGGWYSDSSLKNLFNFNTAITGNKTLYAKWIPVSINLKVSFTLNWNKVSGATGFEVYRATSYSGTYSKIGTTSGTSFTDKNLISGKTYYYKVRSYKYVGTKKVYIKWSGVVAAKKVS